MTVAYLLFYELKAHNEPNKPAAGVSQMNSVCTLNFSLCPAFL